MFHGIWTEYDVEIIQIFTCFICLSETRNMCASIQNIYKQNEMLIETEQRTRNFLERDAHTHTHKVEKSTNIWL